MTIKLLQLSDCHLQTDPQQLYRGCNPDDNLRRCITAASAWAPDALLLSGDLVDHAGAVAYQRLNQQIGHLGLPALAFPGNHDDLSIMNQYLDHVSFIKKNPWQLGDWQIVWLNSNIPGQPHGELSIEKMHVLDQMDPDRPTLLALHHHPVEVQTPWIDRFKLTNPNRLWDKLESIQHNIKAITWGHIHHAWKGEKMIQNKTVELYGSPATSACVQPGSVEFILDPRGPKMRWFELKPSGSFNTGVLSV